MRHALCTLALAAVLGACSSTNEAEVEETVTVTTAHGDEEPAENRRIVLPKGTVFVFHVPEGDTMKIEVEIPEGHADAGTYWTTSEHLALPLGDAMNSMGRPGAEADIEVNAEGEIMIVSNSMTMQ